MSNRSNSVTEQLLEGAVLNNVIAIGTNSTDIGNNTTSIGTNTSDITTLQGQVSDLEVVPGTWEYATGFGATLSGQYQLSSTDFSTVLQIRISKTDLKGVDQSSLLDFLIGEQVTFAIRGRDNNNLYQATVLSDLGTYVQFNVTYIASKSYGTNTPTSANPYFIGPPQQPIFQAFGYSFADNTTDTPIAITGQWVNISPPSISGIPSIFSSTPYWSVSETGGVLFTYSGPTTRVWQVTVTFDLENNNGGTANIAFRSTINGVPLGSGRLQTMRANQFQIISGGNFLPFSPGDVFLFQLKNDTNTDDPLIINLSVNFVLVQ